jgi:hypothetical protein
MSLAFRIPTLALLVALASPVSAQTRIDDQGVFDLTIRGIRAGTITFSGVEAEGRYAVNGKVESAGLVAMLRKFRYVAKARGTVKDGRYNPTSYEEDADTSKRQSKSKITYRAGVPQQITYEPAREKRDTDVNPATMGGSVDPLTALYATLRSVDPGTECTSNVKMFDGRRASQITLSKPVKSGKSVACSGEYRRLKGFSADEMAEKSTFPFKLIYEPTAAGRMQVTEIILETLYGNASMKRR